MAHANTIDDQAAAWRVRELFTAIAIFGFAACGIYFVASFIVPHLPGTIIGWLSKTVLVPLYLLIAQFVLIFLTSGWRAWRTWRLGARHRNREEWRSYILQ